CHVLCVRGGTRPLLSIENDYKGPPEDFAMVVPVPVVLQKENVKTLPHDVFKKLEALSAPRLVEYWEQDPCDPHIGDDFKKKKGAVHKDDMPQEMEDDPSLGATVYAECAA